MIEMLQSSMNIFCKSGSEELNSLMKYIKCIDAEYVKTSSKYMTF